MKLKSHFALLLTIAFLAGLVLSSCDPRRNCNHPDHGRYMNEKITKKRGLPR